LRHTIKHELGPEQLRRAVHRFAETYCQRYPQYEPTTEWQDDDHVEVRFRVKGIKLAGVLELKPAEIAIDLDVPLPLRLFRGKALQTIEETVEPWLEAAKRGELD
jgi:hypothetical protein